ncbi:sensor histidine kinase [Parasutterella excrementihominis]|uniref:sensor histidine kinase n=1 Tax=Parasutterella excrementihominis TaxID=487175 RepID=UPI00266EDC60|nr:ATP-binding protein [Parasutterella excrementihominis]
MKVLIFLLSLVFLPHCAVADTLRLGIANYATQGLHGDLIDASVKELKKVLRPKNDLEFVIYTEEELEEAINNHQIDFFISSSAFYRQMIRKGARDLTSIETRKDDDPNQSEGAIVLVKGGRKDLLVLSDLKKQIVGYSPSFGPSSLQILNGEIKEKGHEPKTFFKKVLSLGPDIDKMLKTLDDGIIDALVLPSCILENFIENNEADSSWLRVLAPRHFSALKCAHSSMLYPGLTFASLPSLNASFSRQITQALLDLDATVKGSFWSVATNFNEVDRLLRSLDQDAWAADRAWSFRNVLNRYWHIVLTIFILVLCLIFYSSIVSLLVRRRTSQLDLALKRERQLKKKSLDASRRIEQMQRIGAFNQLSSLFAHELGQPLYAIRCFCFALRKEINKTGTRSQEVLETVQDIEKQTVRADEIIQKTRNYLKAKKCSARVLLVQEALSTAIETFNVTLHRKAEIRVECTKSSLYCFVDSLDFELIVINLLRNAYEAVQRTGKKPIIYVEVNSIDDYVSVSVEDNGQPVSESLFASLGKGPKTTKEDGLGLGLTIVTSLVENFGGNITFSRTLTGGLKVTVNLPAVKRNNS